MKDTFLNLHEVILVLTLVETLFLCALLKLLPAKHPQPRQILSFFFLLVFGTLLTTLITWNSYLQTTAIAQLDVVPAILSCCLLLQGPVLYLYLLSLSQKVELWHWKNLIHLLPSLIAVSVIFVFNINVIDWLPWTWPSLTAADVSAVKFVWAIVKCFPLIYVLACFHAEYRLRQQLKQVYSSIARGELFWADLVLGGFFIHWFWSFVAYFLGGYLNGYTNDLLGILNNYFTVILVNTLFVFGLLNTRQLLISPQEEPLKAASLPQLDEKIAAIERGIHTQKLYLESQINLERFSEQIGVKARDVSAILNSHYQSNFFEFINRYRVEEAKRLLAVSDGMQDTVLDIVFKSGFNSQSAFHRFFKRLVGVTPSEYRNQQAITNKQK